MRHEWAIDITYEDKSVKRVYFFTKLEALKFKEDMLKWKLNLSISNIGDPIRLHPENAWVSPYILVKLEMFFEDSGLL